MNRENAREGHRNDCYGCEPEQILKIETCPAVLALKDKLDRLSILLDKSQGENHALKRNLDMTKQTICKESGEEPEDFPAFLHKLERHGGLIGRKNTLLKLTAQIEELQNQLKQLEEATLTPGGIPPEEHAKRCVKAERKALWRMELERRQARDEAIKSTIPINKECRELRRKLEAERTRFKEISREVNLHKKHLRIKIDNSEIDMNVKKTFIPNEEELIETVFVISDIRDAYNGVRSRNDVLGKEIGESKDQVRILKEREKDNSVLIDTLTGKHRQVQEGLESEKSIVQRNVARYAEDLRQIDHNFEYVEDLCDHIQKITHEKVDLVKELSDLVNNGFSKRLGEKSECGEESAEHESVQSIPESELGGTNDAKSDVASVKSDDPKPEDGTESIVSEPKVANPRVEKLERECEKYRTLLEAALFESNRLSYVTTVQENRMNDVAIQVVETGRLIMEKSEKKKDLLDTAISMQKTHANRKLLPTPNKDFNINIRVKLEAQREENDFLRALLKAEMENKVQDTYLFKSFVYDTANFFEKNVKTVGCDPVEFKSDTVSNES